MNKEAVTSLEVDHLEMSVYHDDLSHISKSGLVKVLAKPSDFFKAYLDPEREHSVPSREMIVGSAVHALVLEPNAFASCYQRSLATDRRSKSFQNEKKENPDQILLTSQEWESVHRMGQALLTSPSTKSYLDLKGKAETSFFWTDPQTGIACKCRPDFLSDDSEFVIDIKTTRDASPHGFRKSSDDLMYWLSAAMTCSGVDAVRGKKPSAYVFLCVENRGEKNPETAVYFADEEAMELGEFLFRKGLILFAECLKNKCWPGYSKKAEPLGLTYWRKRELEQLRTERGLLNAV